MVQRYRKSVTKKHKIKSTENHGEYRVWFDLGKEFSTIQKQSEEEIQRYKNIDIDKDIEIQRHKAS